MSFAFSTCNRRSALEFLGQLYPDATVKDEGVVAVLLNYVEADQVRIDDPMMHSPATVRPGTHWATAPQAEILAACKAMHAELTKAVPNAHA